MALINIDTSSAVAPVCPEAGEHELRILAAEIHTGKTSGKDMIKVRLEFVAEPTAVDFNHFIMLPHNDMDEKQHNRTLYRLKQMEEALDISLNDLDLDDLVGRTFWAQTSVEEYEGQDQPRFVKFV